MGNKEKLVKDRKGDSNMKRPIKKSEYQWLKKELDFFEKEGSIQAAQKEELLGHYKITGDSNFIRILLTVGAFLIGIGMLSFIASNWMYMSKTVKFLLIIISVIGVNGVGLKIENHNPKMARTLFYIGFLFYGAGIFLIGQMFNLGGSFRNAFLVWALGGLPIAYVLKDKLLLVFITALLFIYQMNYVFDGETSLPYIMLVILPIMYLISKHIHYSVPYIFFMNILTIQFAVLLAFTFIDYDSPIAVLAILFIFLIGIAMLFIPVREKLKGIFEIQGHLIHGVSGIILTFGYFWRNSLFGESFYILFSLAYLVLVLFFIKRGSLLNIMILCALILRFYIDISYDFLPKSLAFVIGGAIFIGFGIYIDKQRKKGGKSFAEE